MARNYTMQEVARIIRAGVDKTTLIDIGKKFPLTMLELAKQNENGLLFAMKLPEKLTARKFEMELRGDVEEAEDEVAEAVDTEEAEVIEKPRKVKAAKKAEMPEPKSWKAMSQYQKKKAKDLGEEYVAACKALDKEEEVPAPKKATKKATKAEKPVVKEDEDEFDLDDDDDAEEEVKPKKAKKEKKEEKKSAKKVKEIEEEDDDDFDDFEFDDDDE